MRTSFSNSNIRSYGTLHRISSFCSAEAIGIHNIVARKFSHLSSADITKNMTYRLFCILRFLTDYTSTAFR